MFRAIFAHHQEDLLYIHSIWFFMCNSSCVTVLCTGLCTERSHKKSDTYSALLPLLPLMRTTRLPVVDWTDAHANLNGLVRFTVRLNLFSARVPSHFNWPLRPFSFLVSNAALTKHVTLLWYVKFSFLLAFTDRYICSYIYTDFNLHLTFNCDTLTRDQQPWVFLSQLPCTSVQCQLSPCTQGAQ